MREIRPEIELLLCCARSRLDSETATRLRMLLKGEVDWQYLLATALEHGLMPLLYWHLSTVEEKAVPDPFLNRLRTSFLHNTARNLLLKEELLKIVRLFERHAIPAIALKGPVLAISAYHNLALRKFTDLDLLIRAQDVQKAVDLLGSEGYSGIIGPERAQESAYIRYMHELDLTRDRINVDLHWSLTPIYFSFRLEHGRLWDRSGQVLIDDTDVKTLSPEDSLLYLSVHGSKHCWQRLGWICDLAQVLQTYQGIDWERLILNARSSGSLRMLYLGLYLADDLLGVKAPDRIMLEAKRDKTVERLAERVRENIFKDRFFPFRTLSVDKVRFLLAAKENLSDRLRYCLYLIARPTYEDCVFVRLPDRLSFLYYLVRPLRLLADLARRKQRDEKRLAAGD